MVSFKTDIFPLFRDKDIQAMKRRIDLSSYEDVKTHSADILDRLQQGDMPCDGAWPPDQVKLFAKWISDGLNP